jgi:TolB protein
LNITSTVDLEIVEIMVNAQEGQTLKGIKAGKQHVINEVPEGGWVAARAYSVNQRADSWPNMYARPFAHSSPIYVIHLHSLKLS